MSSLERSKAFGSGEDSGEEDDFISESEGESISLASQDTDQESGSDADDEREAISDEHYAAIRSTVIDITSALGGLEEETDKDGKISKVYVIGDECLRCLRDLRTLLQQDQDDTTRIVPIIFSEVNVVQRGLLPLLLKAVEMGERGQKIALACTDLITSLTWPIDMAAEIQASINKDADGSSPMPDYRRFQTILVSYKASIIRTRSGESAGSQRSILSTIMLNILLPAISKSRHKRNDRDVGTISMCLHLFRNLLAIHDPDATSLSSAETIALSNLQNDLLVEMEASHVLETLLMLANNADSRDFEAWNIVTAECIFHIFSGALPEQLIAIKQTHTISSSTTAKKNTALQNSLKAEMRQKNSEILSSGISRHSRYSTTINFKDPDGSVRVARTQKALRKSREELVMQYKEKSKKRRFQRKRALDEIGASRPRKTWNMAATKVVMEWAKSFLMMGFEPLIRSVVKDIRSESAKAGDIAQTRTRMMLLSIFFLEYFMLQKTNEDREMEEKRKATENTDDGAQADETLNLVWDFDLIRYWLEPWSLKMAWMRANTARDDRAWLEFTTAVRLWTSILQLVELVSKSPSQTDREVAEGVYAAHFYDELALDAAKSVMKAYTNQSFRCLETIVDFSFVMPKALERYSKDKENLFVKMKKQARKKSNKDSTSADANQEEEDVRRMVESQIKERKFEFEKFQSHLCSSQLVETCFTYLKRWLEVTERVDEHMAGVIHVLHRLGIRASNLRLFWPYEKRMTIKKIQLDNGFWQYLDFNAPKTVEDAKKLFKYILDKFERLDETEKGFWAEGLKAPKPVKVFKMPTEIEIMPSHGYTDDIRIAVGLLMEVEKLPAVMWVKSNLEESLRMKQSILEEEKQEVNESNPENQQESEEDGDRESRMSEALTAAQERFSDLPMSYHDDSQLRNDASTRPEIKLLCRLMHLRSNEDDDHHWIWTVPSSLKIDDLENKVKILEDAIRYPFECFGEPYSSFVKRVRKQNRITRTVVNEFGEEEQVYVPRSRRVEPKRANAFVDDLIEDSDEEIEFAQRILAAQRMAEARNEDAVRYDPLGHQASTSVDGDSGIFERGSPSSDRSDPISSVTGSSIHEQSSPESYKWRKRSRKALFFDSGSEDDEQSADGGEDDSEADQPRDIGSESELSIGRDMSSLKEKSDLSITPRQDEAPPRKRQAVIHDSEDEDD